MKGFPGGMGDIMKQAKQMQQEMEKAQELLDKRVVEGSAGGGMITAYVTGRGRLRKIKIEKEVVDPEDVSFLEDLIVAAVRNASEKAQKLAEGEMSKYTGGLNIPGLF